MPTGQSFGYGIQRLIDADLRFIRNAHPTYLRLRNFEDLQNNLAIQMGFTLKPIGEPTGTRDILIQPTPAVRMVSLHNIGQSMGKLRFGARHFIISASFVELMMKMQGITNQDLVWRGQNVVGLALDNQLFSIEDIAHEEAAGRTVVWTLTCNSNEAR